jgi:acyl-CoA hydrolase
VALLNVSPPDRKGFCTLGVSVDVSLAAALCADVVIAQINPNMPRTHGTLQLWLFVYLVVCFCFWMLDRISTLHFYFQFFSFCSL